MASKSAQAFEIIKGMTLVEMRELDKEVKIVFGSSFGLAVPEVNEKTFQIILERADFMSQYNLITALMHVLQIGQFEAEDLVENVPSVLRKFTNGNDALDLKIALWNVGIEVNINQV